MPYTPPSQLSPASSNLPSPALSRSHSYLKAQSQTPENLSTRPGLPRSTGSSSYLSRHRSSPSIPRSEPDSQSSSVAFSMSNGSPVDGQGELKKMDTYGSIRQSPPPVNNALIPTGATISPPESSHNSSDDDEPQRGRGRDLENLAELQAAIRIIEQRKEGSPRRGQNDDHTTRARMALDVALPHLQQELSTPNNTSADSSRPPLSREARKISHSRSSTDSNIVLDLNRPVQPPRAFEDEDEDDSDEMAIRTKPPMVRKKSGELVRPALRPSSAKRRPSSMPGTPTYSKAVHFDSHLEHVRHFLQVDKPLAVSAGSSPVENYEGEVEFPFGYEEGARQRGPPFVWEIRLSNFPTDLSQREHWPVRVERVFLSSDNKTLVGTIACQNLAFHKVVIARFTLDYWKTTSEVVADYNHDVRRKQNDNCDRFNFSVKLADLANLENKTMFFCIRYQVNGQEYWDNNMSMNYQVDFTKKAKPQHGKNGMPGLAARPLNALPRSKPSPPVSSGSRPKPPALSFDDFTAGMDAYSFDHSPASIMGDSPIKLKNPRPRPEIVPDAPTRRTKGNAQAFGNRYDFSASLTAAIQNASAILGEHSGLKARSDTKQSSRPVPVRTQSNQVASAAPTSTSSDAVHSTSTGSDSSKPAALVSSKPPLSSSSYQELVDKYCFFGSAKSSPQLTKSASSPSGMLDGTNDDASVSDLSVGSAESDGSGASTPNEPTLISPPSLVSPIPGLSAHTSRSASPIPRTGSDFSARSTSPASFGYPFYHSASNGFFVESPTAAAIRG